MITALLALLFAGPPPAVALPAELPARPGRMVRLDADTSGTHVAWLLAADDADLIPFPDGRSALFCAAKPGRYAVYAWTAAGDVPSPAARCVVVVGEPPAPPVDPLAADLKELLDSHHSPEKFANAAQLAAVYREAIRFAETGDVKTAGELSGRIRSAAASLLPADALVSVRKRIAEEIARAMPTDPASPLDESTRKRAAAVFARVAAALEAK